MNSSEFQRVFVAADTERKTKTAAEQYVALNVVAATGCLNNVVQNVGILRGTGSAALFRPAISPEARGSAHGHRQESVSTTFLLHRTCRVYVSRARSTSKLSGRKRKQQSRMVHSLACTCVCVCVCVQGVEEHKFRN